MVCVTCKEKLPLDLAKDGEDIGVVGAVCKKCWAYDGKRFLEKPAIRTFTTGATRDSLAGKLQYEGFFSPLVLKARAEYMAKHQVQTDGDLRDPDNWQKGIPPDALIDSGFRHFMDWWLEHRGHDSREGLVAALCGLMFNAEGYLHGYLQSVAAADVPLPEAAPVPVMGNTLFGLGGEQISNTAPAGVPVTVAGSDEPTKVYIGEDGDEDAKYRGYGI